MHHVHVIPTEARRGHWATGTKVKRELQAAMWVWESNKAGSSGKAGSAFTSGLPLQFPELGFNCSSRLICQHLGGGHGVILLICFPNQILFWLTLLSGLVVPLDLGIRVFSKGSLFP